MNNFVARFVYTCSALCAAASLAACSSSNLPVASEQPTKTMFTTPDVNTMSEAQRDQIVSCIGGESIQPRDIGMDGIYLVGLAKSTDEPRCARWVAGTTENGCDVLFDRTAGTDGRLGVLIIKLVPGADTFERTFEPEQTAEGVNSLVYRICH